MRSPRRTRYIVTLADGTERHIRAYGQQDALDYYNRRNILVASIRAARVSGRQWKLDHAAVKAACDFLGIELPVYVRNTQGLSTGGTHQLLPSYKAPKCAGVSADLYHHITLSQQWGPEKAARALWHELAHAMQSEAAMRDGLAAAGVAKSGGSFNIGDRTHWIKVHREQRRYPYRIRPIEVEARTYEEYAAEMPLVVPA